MEPRFFGSEAQGEAYNLPTPHPPIFPLPLFVPYPPSESEPGKGYASPAHPPAAPLIRDHPKP